MNYKKLNYKKLNDEEMVNMITKEEWLEIKKGYERIDGLIDLVIEKYKEKEEVRTGIKWSEDNVIENVEFQRGENDYIKYDHFSLDIRYGRRGCVYTESDTIDVKFLYDENYMEEYRREIEEKKMEIEKRIKERDELYRKRKEEAEEDNLFELAKKHGYVLATIDDGFIPSNVDEV